MNKVIEVFDGCRIYFWTSSPLFLRSISPLYWSINNGSVDCAKLILEDLLSIRADRENYYYGADALFFYHPELVLRLCDSAAWT